MLWFQAVKTRENTQWNTCTVPFKQHQETHLSGSHLQILKLDSHRKPAQIYK